MPITVYTYHDPYKLKENTNLWKEISSCPYFCVSQTLVNGLKSVYGLSLIHIYSIFEVHYTVKVS